MVDKLIQITGAHRKISEISKMYEEILNKVSYYEPLAYVKTLNALFNDTLFSHFEFEEKKLFPIIFDKGDEKVRALLLTIEEEHKQIINKLAQLNKLKSESASGADAKERLFSLCGEITKDLNKHALKEDTQLFPVLKEADLKSL